jgi:uncharacterized protein
VLLGVGYAACHWCHVMAHESFEDEATAAYLNNHFVSVKIDREERPDVDAVYMNATQAIIGHGGWPMTCVLDHDRVPFFAGTYFPDGPRQGSPSFRQVRDALAGRRHPGARVRPGQRRLRRRPEVPALDGAGVPAAQPRSHRRPAVEADARRDLCGHGPRRALRPARRWVCPLLRRRRMGGVVPHFEKMLYDNAQLLGLYARWGGHRVAGDSADFLLRELRTAEGGFASALDADTEGVEGKFYAWTPAQLREARRRGRRVGGGGLHGHRGGHLRPTRTRTRRPTHLAIPIRRISRTPLPGT